MTHQPRLWHTADDVARLRARLAAGDPVVTALARLAAARVAALPEITDPLDGETSPLAACAVHYLLTGDAAPARWAAEQFLAYTAAGSTGNLTLAGWALQGAVLHAACYDAWTPAQGVAMSARLAGLAAMQREIDRHVGNPHIVTNNHWAVSHAGAAMAAMAAHGHPRDDGTPWDLREAAAWGLGRVRAFVLQHGDHGLYHEGIGYQLYPMAFWLPAVLAARGFDGTDLLADLPHLRLLPSTLYALAAARPVRDEAGALTGAVGMKLSWNDDGQGWCRSNVAVLLTALASPEHAGPLRRQFDRLSGLEGDGAFAPAWCGWYFALCAYPYDTPAAPPDALPRAVLDGRQGLAIFRNRYAGADDAVLGAYARATFVGGHRQDDAGSLRLMALDHDWILGGGQARADAAYQSVVAPADGSRVSPPGLGAVIWHAATPKGGVVAMDLRNVNRAYSERYAAVDYSGACGAPVALALLDLVDDHHGRDWHWNLTFAPELVFTADADGRGFTLAADDGATLAARFLGVAPDGLACLRMPDSARTFQSGAVVQYPGRPYVQAYFAARPHLAIYMVLTIQRGPGPTIALGDGVDVRLGTHPWSRPFQAAVPAAYDLVRAGTLCRYPDGCRA
jgi:hypothetical protein